MDNKASGANPLQEGRIRDKVDPDSEFWREFRRGLLVLAAAVERRYGPKYGKSYNSPDDWQPEATLCTRTDGK